MILQLLMGMGAVAEGGGGGDPVAADVTPASLSSSYTCSEGFLPGSCPLTQDIAVGAATALPSGGTGPYTYWWVGSGVTFSDRTAQVVGITVQGVPANTTTNTTASCYVYDSLGASAFATVDLSATYTRFT